MAIMKPFNRRDLALTVVDGVAQSELCLVGWIHSFAVKCPDAAKYELEFRDQDDYGIWKEDNVKYTGPVARKVNAKCTAFVLYMTNATDGEYKIRVGVE